MKIIEALKKLKDYSRKIADIQKKIAEYCADMDIDTPTYGSEDKQRSQIAEWVQSVHDMVKEVGNLKQRLRLTNLKTMVVIEIDGKRIEKSIAEWIDRRIVLSKTELVTWQCLTNKNLKPQNFFPDKKDHDSVVLTKPRLYFDPKQKDHMVEVYSEEPSLIDGRLEVINAETDLL